MENENDDLKGLFEPTQPGDDFFKCFGMIIPQVALKTQPQPKKSFLCRIGIHKWGFAGLSFSGPGHPRRCERCSTSTWFNKPPFTERIGCFVGKWSDKIFRPLCWIGWHHWKGGFAMHTYSFGIPGPVTKSVNHTCTRCRKHKLVEEA